LNKTLSAFSHKLDSVVWQTLPCDPVDLDELLQNSPTPKSSPHLHYFTQNLAAGTSSEQGPQCSRFHHSPKGRMLWKQGLL